MHILFKKIAIFAAWNARKTDLECSYAMLLITI